MFRCLFLVVLFGVGLLYAQQTKVVDFKRAEALIAFNPFEIDSTVYNSYEISFDVLQPTDSIYLDALNMRFKHVALNGQAVNYHNTNNKLVVYNDFETSKNNSLSFVFFAAPKKAMYFMGWDSKAPKQIWTQGQGKYTSNWLPSLDDTNDKIEFDITYAAPKGFEVIGNGKLVSKLENTTYDLWEYDMSKPMSSYLVAVALGAYQKQTETSKSGIPLEYYYYPEDSLKVEPTYRYTKQMFDFLEEEIGYPYPWQNYKQVPVHDFLYSGMENTSLTIFSDAFMVDDIGFNDKNYVNVNAHELAHQWFGDLVTAKSGEHHWLQEGFATYYALLAEKQIFGSDYYIWELYKSAQDLSTQDLAGQGTSLLNPKASSLTFYQRGAWVVHMLRQMIGETYFKATVKNYLERYAFSVATTKDFMAIAEQESGYDLTAFVNTWIKAEEFPYEEAMAHLKAKSQFIQEYIMIDCEVKTSKCADYLKYYASDKVKAKVIAQIPDLVTKDVFKNGLEVRQAIAKNLQTIPVGLKSDYESLLYDKSYITIEAALYNLWVNFAEDRFKYLDNTEKIVGFNDRNVRQLWLVLALNTEGYRDDQKQALYNELVNYSTNQYGFETRRLAFTYLNTMNAFNKEALMSLKSATNHHNWRFKNFAKDLVEVLSQNPEYKDILKAE